MPDTKTLNINLLKKKGNTTFDTFLHWAITGGRFIVILTETVALASFLYRFTLDRQLVDLRDQIESKAAIVSSLKTQEDSYRSVQNRIKDAKEITTTSQKPAELLNTLVEVARGKVVFQSLTIGDNKIHMDITTNSGTLLDSFIATLRLNDQLENVSIDRIENRTTTAVIAVSISAQVKGGSKTTQEQVAQPNL